MKTLNRAILRVLDILIALMALCLLLPATMLIALLILLDSKGGILYVQPRIGLHGKPFCLYKFRTMNKDPNNTLKLTIGNRDPRITKVGYVLRKYKLDEIPQLWNIILGHMSFVGPRPEVAKYVNLYTPEQKKILSIKPGLTDFASIEFIDENSLLAKQANPEQYYIDEIIPLKISLNQKFLQNPSPKNYFICLFRTFFSIFR